MRELKESFDRLLTLTHLSVNAVSLRTLAQEFYYPDVLKHKMHGVSIYENSKSRKVLRERLRRFVKKLGFQIKLGFYSL